MPSSRRSHKVEVLSPEEQVEKAIRENEEEIHFVLGPGEELPENISQLTQLKHLGLYMDKAVSLPKFVPVFSNLESLTINGTTDTLEFLPEEIGDLKNLKLLGIYFTNIKTLPRSLGKLSNLEHWDMIGSNIEELPNEIGGLAKLKIMRIVGSRLEMLPEVFEKLNLLEELSFASSNIKKIPESIGALGDLKSLRLSNSQTKDIPASFSGLKSLISLDVSGNKFGRVPENLRFLNQLIELDLSDNEIAKLPDWISEFNKLQSLYLHGNNLRLPSEVLGLTQHDIFLSSNRRKEEIKPAKPADIISYYFSAKAEERPLNEAKLILLGKGNAGKTSLVNRLVHEKFKPEQKTEGIKITEWAFSLFDKEDVRLNVWDFGGQEIMHATHQFFLTQRSLYLLVINGREGEEESAADYWLKLIENFGDSSPVIVVLNKQNEHPFSLNEEGLKRKFPNIREIIKTDCQDGTGIEELRRAIQRETDRLDGLRDLFPASWFAIKDGLSNPRRRSNYISFKSYQTRCKKLGETDAYWQKQLAVYLHRLGVALNFSEDPRLNDTHVLNPRWVTEGIYKILNSRLLEEQRGEIVLDDLSKMLEERKYPATMHRFLIDLMKKFDLCFSYADDECHYLIPELLDKQEPSAVREFDPVECLNFQYHYPVALEGLLPRFIVRAHNLIDGDLRWRTGAILQFEGCQALVRADMQDKKVFVSVKGSMNNRRRLLAVVRTHFESIHASFKSLEVEEVVPIPGHPKENVSYEDLIVFEESSCLQFPKAIDGKMQILSVPGLLNGVDLEGSRKRENFMDKQTQPTRLFYSYSHKDEALCDELETHLSIMRRQHIIDVWHDRKIGAGTEWKNQIDENLEKADVVLLLISSDFLASDYCYDKEMKRAMERHDAGEAIVIPVILRDCDWHDADFGKLQGLPKDGKAVTLWPNKDTAWRDVSEGIKKRVKDLREAKGI